MPYLKTTDIKIGKLIKFHNDIGIITDTGYVQDRVEVVLSSGEKVYLRKCYLRDVS